LSETHQPLGLDAVDEQVQLAFEFMDDLMKENLK
jgi:hypothetical protein